MNERIRGKFDKCIDLARKKHRYFGNLDERCTPKHVIALLDFVYAKEGIGDGYYRGGAYTENRIAGCLDAAIRAMRGGKRKKARKAVKRQISWKEASEFYASWEWRQARYEVLREQGRKCVCCGATPEGGAVLHVDHIKPLRDNWSLRLRKSNLQVLCGDCNAGKGFKYKDDWRAPA